jgi:hypothetical protein
MKMAKIKKCRVLACLLASLLIFLSFLHAEFSLMATVAVEYVSLTNNTNGKELEPFYKFQIDEETTQLYLFGGSLIWVSSYYPHDSRPIAVEQEQESGDDITVTGCGYLTSDFVLYPVKGSETHEHDHHDFKLNFVVPTDLNRRRLGVFT